MALALMCHPGARAQQGQCDLVNEPPHPQVPAGQNCPTGVPDSSSACWYAGNEFIYNNDLAIVDPKTGFPLNINLWQGPGPSDFPPRSLDPILSSSPLLAGEVTHFRGPSPHRERPTYHDVIDLITGVPLLQEIDFELPFGSAVFRHVRTYSEPASRIPWNGNDGILKQPATGAFWDWNGLFWMMGENPLFLIDSAYPGITHGPGVTNSSEVRRCYFVPDAHHAIPFIFDEFTHTYAAPPWFDAVMGYSADGVLDSNGEWTTRPSEFYVWLHRQSVKYTFQAHYEDHWVDPEHLDENNNLLPINKKTPDPDPYWVTNGIPHYAILTRIEDRYGNTVEIEHCAFHGEGDCDEPSSTTCVECCQNCNEKGQIKRILLRSASGAVVWTLAYTHRGFTVDTTVCADIYERERRQAHALHTIHVYQGERPVSDSCLTIPAAAFCSVPTFDEVDLINHEFVDQNPDWVIEARYCYSQELWDDSESVCPGAAFPHDDCLVTLGAIDCEQQSHEIRVGKRLLKATVTRRTEDQQGQPVDLHTHSLYRDEQRYMWHDMTYSTFLKAVYNNDVIQAILEGFRRAGLPQQANVNHLLTLGNDEEVPVAVDAEPGSPTYEMKPLIEVASLNMPHYDDSAWNGYDVELSSYGPELVTFFGGELDRTTLLYNSRHILKEREDAAGDGAGGLTAFYYFLRFPSTAQHLAPSPNACAQDGLLTYANLYHYPYRFALQPGQYCSLPPPGNYFDLQESKLDEVFFITVIDTLGDDDEDPENDDDMLVEGYNPPQLNIYDPITREGLKRRRVVEMNPAGFVLRDRTWSFEENEQGQIVSQEGFAEEFKYDDKGRKIERRSKGWASAENTQTGSQGVIQVLDYHPDGPDGTLGEVRALGIKNGTNGATYWISRNARDANRPELVTEEVAFPTPVTDMFAAGGNATTTSCVFQIPDPQNPKSARIIEKEVRRPASPLAQGGTTYQPFEKTFYDERGNQTCLAVGSVPEGAAIGDALTTFLSVSSYDELGQLTMRVDDALSFNGLSRKASAEAGPELALTTEGFYDPIFGRVRTKYPNGKENRIVYRMPNDTDLEQWAYTDVQFDQTNGTFQTLSPVEIVYYSNGRLTEKKKVKLIGGTQGEPEADETYEVISTSTPQYDSAGRMVGTKEQGEGETFSIWQGISYNGFGLVTRQEDSDGTITRNVFDDHGRLDRAYRGTSDIHVFWGTAGPNDPFDDNMVLTEKRYYGSGVTDADQLIEARHYRSKPQNQYYEEGEGVPENNEDDVGWRTLHEYDWRMREVAVTRMTADVPGGPPAEPVTISITWYDHLNRVRYVAEYDGAAGVPAAVDPRLSQPGDVPPNSSDFFASGLLSLSETLYNDRGLPDKVRNYKIPAAPPYGTPSYTVTRTFYDHINRPVEVRAPDSPVQRFVFDGQGRQILTLSIAAGVEVERTKTIYDADNRAIQTIRYERKDNGNGPTLDSTNSIMSYAYVWYDLAGRVTASVNLGTYGNGYENGPTPPGREGMPSPAQYDANGKLIGCSLAAFGSDQNVLATCYEYDDEGRQTAILHPDGRFIRQEYDNLGRLLMTIENAGDSDPKQRQVKAYRYECQDVPTDCHGTRLTKMAAVLPNHGDGDITTYGEIVWNANDGTLQVSEFVYNADVLDEGGNPVSENGAWISEAHYPGPGGQPDPDPALTFDYTFDGLVSQRSDARGMIFTHSYDALSRRIETTIDDSDWYVPPQQGQPDSRPLNRISRIGYEHLPDGKLASVTAYSMENNVEVVLAHNVYSYDAFDNLSQEVQSHGGLAQAGSPAVDYLWEFNPASDENFNRLVSITYPGRVQTGSRRAVTFTYGVDGSIDDELNRITKINDSLAGELSTYTYMGHSRRIAMTLGSQLNQAFAGGAGYTGLDRFTRIADLKYTLDNGSIVHRYQYGYDAAGNRKYARVRQATGPDGFQHINDRSYLYAYDGLHRLLDAKLGKLTSTNDAIDLTGPVPREVHWNLDNLGNWSGEDPTDGSVVITQGSNVERLHHSVNSNNQITELYVDGVNVADPVHDPAGSYTSDGQKYYQYDAWNRLLQINLIGTAVLDADGRIIGGQLGDLILRFAYDGLGRLIRKEAMIPNPSGTGPQVIRTTQMYYDGVRRIQEVITQPDDPPPNEEVWTDREYVYGPEYVDEFICQIDADASVMYMLQDGNYNVVAVTNSVGALLDQYVYDPYGKVLVAETYSPAHAANRVGHQGLFFDRLDASADQPALVANADGLYQNRNRSYNPELGRFMSRDMNETALPVLTAIAMNGLHIAEVFGEFDPTMHFGDGMNLYQYQRSNPVNLRDPLGLSIMEDADAAIAQYYADRAAFAEYAWSTLGGAATRILKTAAVWAVVAGLTAFSPVLGMAAGIVVGVYGVYTDINDILENGWSWGRGVSLAMNAVGLGASLYGFKAALSGARATYNARRAGSVGCFIAGTLVSLPDGSLRPIEEIFLEDHVLAVPDPAMSCAPEPGMVTQTSRRTVPFVVELELHSSEGKSVVVTTPEHPFYLPSCDEYVPAEQLRLDDCLFGLGGSEIEVTSVLVRAQTSEVYNFEVEGAHNYFVALPDTFTAILVHNGPCNYFAEKPLYGSQKHGVHWKEAYARAKEMGIPQGKFGTEADVEWVVNQAKSQKLEVGNYTLKLPAGHGNTITWPDGSVTIANHVWFKVHANGKIHGYPTP